MAELEKVQHQEDPGSINGASMPEPDLNSEKILAHTKFLEMVEKDGWTFARRANCKGVVAVIAVTEDRKLVLTEQYRIPVGKRVIDLPAGLVSDESLDETFIAAALEELEEETGFVTDGVKHLFKKPSSAGLTNETTIFYLARTLKKVGEGGGVGNEDIQVHLIPLDSIDQWIFQQEIKGKLVSPKVDVALRVIANSGL